MALFSKAKRFPPEKPDQVPGPGAYDPKLHDPLDDHWRKGPLEIYTVPRDKKLGDPAPDTFGLYNPDLSISQPHPSKPRPRSISTHAAPSSKHLKDLLRLESLLHDRESQITSLTTSIQQSDQASKELRRALHRSEIDNKASQSEVEKLRKQIQSVAGLHGKLVELQEEHERSKKRREKEIAQVKDQLRQAEDRAARYLDDKKQADSTLDMLRKQTEAADGARLAGFRRANDQLLASFTQMAAQRDASNRALQRFQATTRLADVRTHKTLAARAAQVAELVVLVNEATLREELLDDFVDSLLEDGEQMAAQGADAEAVLELERARHQLELDEVQQELRAHEQLFDGILFENKAELAAVSQESRYRQTELEGGRLVNKALQDALAGSCVAYQELSSACRQKCTALDRAEAELGVRDHTIAQLTSTLETLKTDHAGLQAHTKQLVHTHACAAEAWQARQAALEARVREAEEQREEERDRWRKAENELLVAKQAEAALRGEVEHFQTLTGHLHSTEQELGRLASLNDLLIRQSDLNADQADKVAKVNEELAGHGNQNQKVRVLERLRREIREEKENTAKLENLLWSARSEIKGLKDELAAYRSVSHPSSHHQTIGGLSRVARRAQLAADGAEERVVLSEVGGSGVQNAGEAEPGPDCCPAATKPAVRPTRIAQPKKPSGGAHLQTRASKVPTFKALVAQRMAKKPDGKQAPGIDDENHHQIGAGPVSGDCSLGAIKMQGKMTLEELR